jgi:hypothetical protein
MDGLVAVSWWNVGYGRCIRRLEATAGGKLEMSASSRVWRSRRAGQMKPVDKQGQAHLEPVMDGSSI